MPTIKRSVFINASAEKSQQYVRMPENWGHWFVNAADIKNIQGNGEIGTSAEGYIPILGMHFPVKFKVVEDELVLGEKCRYVLDITGGIQGKLIGTSLAHDNGVEVTLEMEYEVPGGVFGQAIDALLIHKIEDNALAHTLENLKVINEAQ